MGGPLKYALQIVRAWISHGARQHVLIGTTTRRDQCPWRTIDIRPEAGKVAARFGEEWKPTKIVARLSGAFIFAASSRPRNHVNPHREIQRPKVRAVRNNGVAIPTLTYWVRATSTAAALL
jgi:hypothetical protein